MLRRWGPPEIWFRKRWILLLVIAVGLYEAVLGVIGLVVAADLTGLFSLGVGVPAVVVGTLYLRRPSPSRNRPGRILLTAAGFAYAGILLGFAGLYRFAHGSTAAGVIAVVLAGCCLLVSLWGAWDALSTRGGRQEGSHGARS